MKKVSIIIPAYNAEKHIKQCIERLLRQTYKNIELIVVNDASKDNTLDVLNNLLDQRLQVINLPNNSGAYCARKAGLKMATGEYILYVDVDDYLEDNAIKNLVEYINSYNADIVKFRYIKEPCKLKSDILFQGEKKPFLIENKMNSIQNSIKKLYANCAFRISIDETVNQEELEDFLDNRFKPAVKFLGRMRTRHGEE